MFKRFGWIFLAALFVGPFLGFVTGGVIAYISPKLYQAESVIQIRPGPIDTPPHSSAPSVGTPNFLTTQLEVIKTSNTLGQVIDQLDLTQRWAVDKSTAIDQLGNIIETANLQGTDLIKISTKATNPMDAKEINEALVEAYTEQRIQLETARTDAALNELQEAVRTQEDHVEDRRRVLTAMIRNGQHDDLLHREPGSDIPPFNNPDLASSPPPPEAKHAARLESECIKLESQIDSLLRFDGDQLMTYAAGLNLPENIVRTLHPQWLEAKRELAALKVSGLGAEHPQVIQQKQIVEGMATDLEKGVIQLRETLRAQLDLTKGQAARLRPDVEENPADAKLAKIHFDNAKSDFEAAQSLLEQLKLKLISEKMGKRISNNLVTIHAKPLVPNRPVAPNVPLLLLGGTGAGLVFGVLGALILIPMLNMVLKEKPESTSTSNRTAD